MDIIYPHRFLVKELQLQQNIDFTAKLRQRNLQLLDKKLVMRIELTHKINLLP
jgi:hypothetical protein